MENQKEEIEEIIKRIKDKTQSPKIDIYNNDALYIARVSNGYIIKEMDEEEGYDPVSVVECDGDEKETMTELLTRISEFFGVYYNKHVYDNLNITWDKVGENCEEKGLVADIEEILKGIDEMESDTVYGWWETSTGAEFGARIKESIINRIKREQGKE